MLSWFRYDSWFLLHRPAMRSGDQPFFKSRMIFFFSAGCLIIYGTLRPFAFRFSAFRSAGSGRYCLSFRCFLFFIFFFFFFCVSFFFFFFFFFFFLFFFFVNPPFFLVDKLFRALSGLI